MPASSTAKGAMLLLFMRHQLLGATMPRLSDLFSCLTLLRRRFLGLLLDWYFIQER
jgi:hypothetical protein